MNFMLHLTASKVEALFIVSPLLTKKAVWGWIRSFSSLWHSIWTTSPNSREGNFAVTLVVTYGCSWTGYDFDRLASCNNSQEYRWPGKEAGDDHAGVSRRATAGNGRALEKFDRAETKTDQTEKRINVGMTRSLHFNAVKLHSLDHKQRETMIK